MVGKKKGVSSQKESSHVETGEEGKENREKGGEKDVARRRGGVPRRGRGASRGRECECHRRLCSLPCPPCCVRKESTWMPSDSPDSFALGRLSSLI